MSQIWAWGGGCSSLCFLEPPGTSRQRQQHPSSICPCPRLCRGSRLCPTLYRTLHPISCTPHSLFPPQPPTAHPLTVLSGVRAALAPHGALVPFLALSGQKSPGIFNI